jgi:transcriptional regulator GlxA family with amidase domain
MEEESRQQSEGWQQVVRRLSEVLFVHVLREYMQRAPHTTGALAALADPALGSALRALHADPAKAWTVENLAERANMSRSVFAESFKASLGITPAKYLLLWRMQKARALLERTRSNVASVAKQVGYASEAAFSRAFKECVGVSPGQYQREHQSGLPLNQ